MERSSSGLACEARYRRTDVERRAGAAPKLEFFNGLGGFADDGREYVTILGPGQSTPAPWINVIANPTSDFRSQPKAAATPGPPTAARTSSRLVERSVTDRPGEAFYLRDEDTGGVWTPTALPIRDEPRPMSPVMAAATAASSMRRTASRSICCSSCRSTTRSRFRASELNNLSSRPGLSVTAYVEWVLGSVARGRERRS